METSTLNSKFSSPKKIVRKVLGKNSQLEAGDNINKEDNDSREITCASTNSTEILNLKELCSGLQSTILTLQLDVERKEEALADLAREKQQLYVELKKERRSSISLKQQLDDERKFYYKEKQTFCQEMNDCKRLKQDFNSNVSINHEQCKREAQLLKEQLGKTSEANYNLCIKFLRMRNTKLSLKSRLKQFEEDHKQTMQDFHTKITSIKNEVLAIAEKGFNLPIAPNTKKYLQVVKQNGVLMHDNLTLQTKIDTLKSEIEVIRLRLLKSESHHNLRYVQSTVKQIPSLQKHPNEGYNKAQQSASFREITTKIFEREVKKDMPEIVLMENYNDDASFITKNRFASPRIDDEIALSAAESQLALMHVSEDGDDHSIRTKSTAPLDASGELFECKRQT